MKHSNSSLNYGDTVLVTSKSKTKFYTSTGVITGYNKGFVIKLSSGKTIIENPKIRVFKLIKHDTKRKA